MSAAGASLPKEATVSFTDGVDVCRAKEETKFKINSNHDLLDVSGYNLQHKQVADPRW